MVVALGNSTAPSTPALLQSIVAGRGGIVRFTVDDVLAMIDQGILPEDSTTELLDGLIVHKDRSDRGGDPLMHGPKHRLAVRRLIVLAGRVETPNFHGQVQLPIVCATDHMPEPDFSLIRGTDRDYASRLPSAADTFVVIEAADSSLYRDRMEKLPRYAAAGIPQYVIVNIETDSVENYLSPDVSKSTYAAPVILQRGQVLQLLLGPFGAVDVAVSDLLP
jgi:hypothetical protein